MITIFPEAFESPLKVGLLGKAIEKGAVEVGVHDLRQWAPPGAHRAVDDVPYGGGPGMVMTPAPVVEAVEAVRRPGAKILFLSAAGRRFDQSLAREWSQAEQIVLVCGRYEGIDARASEILGAEEVSVGDFVLAGGEAAALVVIEVVSRLTPGFMGNEESLAEESFTSGLLEYPHYTRPPEYRGRTVPEVLLSGDHAKIAAWRQEQAQRRTEQVRPDLL